MAEYLISPLTEKLAEAVILWHYAPPYQVYDLSPDDLAPLLDPYFRYHQVLDRSGNLVGYCCYGEDARVPGGDYSRGEPEVLDVGVGLHPELVGKGLGPGFVQAILAHGSSILEPDTFRVTVADFNQRSLKTFRKLGFRDTNRLERDSDGMPFTQLEKSAHD